MVVVASPVISSVVVSSVVVSSDTSSAHEDKVAEIPAIRIKTEIIETKDSKIFNYLIICTAPNKVFAQNLLVALLEYAKNEFNQINSGLEGYKKADWIIVDYGKIAVHIFSQETREKFNIEKLWR